MFVVGVDIEPLPAHLATFLAYALFVSVLIPIFLIDIEHFVIPDELNAVLLIIGLLFAGLVPNAPTAWCFIDLGVVNFKNALIGAEIGVFFWAFVAIGGRLLFRKDALGHGDIKLARGIGALLMMPGALAVFMISVFIGVFAGVPFILWRSQKEPELAKNKWKQFVNWVVQLVSSKNKCKRFIDCVVQLISKKPPVESEEPSEPEEPPETIPSLLLHAIVYLFWLDLFVLFLPKRTQLKFYVTLSRVTGDLPPDFNFEEALAEATNPPDEKEDYKPTITTIPFGPSLVCGVLVVIYFGGTVVGWYKAYLAWAGLS
jgi:prepilin signal peptidase PulO-like enzyme (type II secretory pathway)